MAAESVANPGSGPAPTRTADPPATQPAATQASTPPAKQPADELLCTICGLTACWTKPGASPKPAGAPAPAVTTDSSDTNPATPR